MASVIVFDLNETLLDLSALDPLFEHADRHQLPQRRPCGCSPFWAESAPQAAPRAARTKAPQDRADVFKTPPPADGSPTAPDGPSTPGSRPRGSRTRPTPPRSSWDPEVLACGTRAR